MNGCPTNICRICDEIIIWYLSEYETDNILCKECCDQMEDECYKCFRNKIFIISKLNEKIQSLENNFKIKKK